MVSAGTLLPGFDDGDYQPRDRRLLATEDRWHREPPLQRLLFSRRLIYILGVLALVLVAVLVAWWLTAGRYTTMPKVTGLTARVATSELKDLHFQVQRGPSQHSDVPSGHVLSTSPAPGAKVRQGGTITIVVSLGPVLIDVPPVTGQPIAQADQALKAKGLTPGQPQGEASTTIPAGRGDQHRPGGRHRLAQEQAGRHRGQLRPAAAQFRRPAARPRPRRPPRPAATRSSR